MFGSETPLKKMMCATHLRILQECSRGVDCNPLAGAQTNTSPASPPKATRRASSLPVAGPRQQVAVAAMTSKPVLGMA